MPGSGIMHYGSWFRTVVCECNACIPFSCMEHFCNCRSFCPSMWLSW